MQNERKRRWGGPIKALALALVVFFWFIYLRENWREIRDLQWSIEWPATAKAAVLFLSGYLLLGVLWAPLHYEFTGVRLGVLQAFRISALAWMGRYIPGKVWALLGKVTMTSGGQPHVIQTGVAATVETLWFEASGILLAVILFPFTGPIQALPIGSWLLLIVFLAGALIVVHPAVFCPLVNQLLKWLRRPPLGHRPRYGALLLFTVGYMGTFLLWGTAFTVLARSVTTLGLSDLPLMTAIFSVCWVIGFLTFLAPAGLGVRESALALALQPFVPSQGTVIMLAVGSRLLTTLVEMLCLLLALAITYLTPKPNPPTPAA